MCSLNDYQCDNEGIETPVNDEEPFQTETNEIVCRKCHSERVEVLLRNREGYCKPCFLIRTTHKFKAALGKSKIIRRNDSILVAYSGKPNSTVLLHLINNAMHESMHKKLILKITVFYIDEGIIDGRTIEERQATLHAINKIVESFGFVGCTTSLSQSLEKPSSMDIKPLDALQVVTKGEDALIQTFDALADNSARKEFKCQLRRRLLLSVAQTLCCDKVFLADSSTDIAVKILSSISLGRGAQLSFDTGFADTRADIMLLKPLRDFTCKEIEYYITCYRLNSVQCAESTNHRTSTSIQDLTTDFVTNLDAEHCGTISTIFRTGEKLGTELPIEHIIRDKCVLCHAHLDTSTVNNDVSAIQATRFSRLMSSKITEKESNAFYTPNDEKVESNKGDSCCKNNSCRCTESKLQKPSMEYIEKYLCYSCRLIFYRCDVKNVPQFISNTIDEMESLSQMKEQISDFLL